MNVSCQNPQAGAGCSLCRPVHRHDAGDSDPIPMQGYVNLGDCAVLLSAWVLGPVYGGVAAGTGSMLADLFSGYAHYAPGTFLIKLCMAVAAALIFRFLRNRPASKLLLAQGASGLVAGGCHGGKDTSAIPACGWARVWLLPLLSRATSYKAPLASSRPLRFMSFLNRSSALARI